MACSLQKCALGAAAASLFVLLLCIFYALMGAKSSGAVVPSKLLEEIPSAPPKKNDHCNSTNTFLSHVAPPLHTRRVNETAWEVFLSSYALNSALLGSVVKDGSYARMEQLHNKLLRKQDIVIDVFGGSFVLGAGGGETENHDDAQCAWPARAQMWLSDAFPDVPVHFTNRANHGIDSAALARGIGVIARGLTRIPDLLVIDVTVNDAAGGTELNIAYESLIRTVLTLLPSTQLLLIEDGCPPCMNLLSRRREIAQHYQIPVLDYGGLVHKYNKDSPSGPDKFWPHTEPEYAGPWIKPGAVWPDFSPANIKVVRPVCCAGNHPPWPVHQYYADAFRHTLLHMLRMFCEATTPFGNLSSLIPAPLVAQAHLDEYRGCLEPLTVFDANHPKAELLPNVTILSGNWTLFEDRPGRPGWIATARGSAISFRVKFRSRSLALTYLRSYESIGTATMHLQQVGGQRKRSGDHKLNGVWEKRVSLPQTDFLFDAPNAGILFGFITDTETYYDVIITFDGPQGSKFKLIGLHTC